MPIYRCTLCDKVLATDSAIRKHVTIVHDMLYHSTGPYTALDDDQVRDAVSRIRRNQQTSRQVRRVKRLQHQRDRVTSKPHSEATPAEATREETTSSSGQVAMLCATPQYHAGSSTAAIGLDLEDVRPTQYSFLQDLASAHPSDDDNNDLTPPLPGNLSYAEVGESARATLHMSMRDAMSVVAARMSAPCDKGEWNRLRTVVRAARAALRFTPPDASHARISPVEDPALSATTSTSSGSTEWPLSPFRPAQGTSSEPPSMQFHPDFDILLYLQGLGDIDDATTRPYR